MVKIVALDGYTLNPGDLSWDEVGMHGTLDVFHRSTPEEAIERVKNVDILIVNKFALNEEVLAHCNQLKLVCVSATGYNNVDIAYCKAKNIQVCNVSNYSSSSVAQHTFALLLHYYNQVSNHHSLVKKGFWSICPDFSFTASSIHELKGKTFGILGFGDIARKVANIALAFEMDVIVHRKNIEKKVDDPIKQVSLDALFTQSDILSLHADLNTGTKHIINSKTLNRMKRSAILINTSRGGLVQEDDLANALLNQRIAAALLDVLETEPAKLSHPFYQLSNCYITPHMAWASVESRQRLMSLLAENINSFFLGTLKNIVA